MNRLYSLIPNPKIDLRCLKLDPFDYKMLMKNSTRTCPKDLIALYETENNKYKYSINQLYSDGREEDYDDSIRKVAIVEKNKFLELGYSEEELADMLVEYNYGTKKKRRKQLLWLCFGDLIYENLKNNLQVQGTNVFTKIIRCVDCGEYVDVSIKDTKTCRCSACQYEYKKAYNTEFVRQKRSQNKICQ